MTQRIIPMIAYEDTAAAIDWLSEAFGFTEREAHRHTDEKGVVGHAELLAFAQSFEEKKGPPRGRQG